MDILLEEIEESEQKKQELFRRQNQVEKLEDELGQLRLLVEKKRGVVAVLCETESKNINLIEKLEGKLRNQTEVYREGRYEKKYRELARHMDEYINSTNEAQEEFTRNYALLKAENSRLYHQAEQFSTSLKELEKKTQMLTCANARYEKAIKDGSFLENELNSKVRCL